MIIHENFDNSNTALATTRSEEDSDCATLASKQPIFKHNCIIDQKGNLKDQIHMHMQREMNGLYNHKEAQCYS